MDCWLPLNVEILQVLIFKLTLLSQFFWHIYKCSTKFPRPYKPLNTNNVNKNSPDRFALGSLSFRYFLCYDTVGGRARHFTFSKYISLFPGPEKLLEGGHTSHSVCARNSANVDSNLGCSHDPLSQASTYACHTLCIWNDWTREAETAWHVIETQCCDPRTAAQLCKPKVGACFQDWLCECPSRVRCLTTCFLPLYKLRSETNKKKPDFVKTNKQKNPMFFIGGAVLNVNQEKMSFLPNDYSLYFNVWIS